MALLQKNSYEAGNTDLTNLMETVDMQRKGYVIEVDTANKQIEEGAVLDINGGLYYTDSDTTITDNGTAWGSISNDSVFYVYAVGGGTDEFQYSTTAPSFDAPKGGWYNGNERAIVKAYKDGSGNFAEYGIYGYDNDNDGVFRMSKTLDIGDWNMDSTTTANVAHGLTYELIRDISVSIRDDSDAIRYNLIGSTYTGIAEYHGGGVQYNSTNITLIKTIGGTFDNVEFDSTSYNRGWITVWYEI